MRSRFLFFILIGLISFLPAISFSDDYVNSYADLVEKLRPAVVNIATEHKASNNNPIERKIIKKRSNTESLFEDFNDLFQYFAPLDENMQNKNTISLGSGFIIDSSGVIVTSYHVIADSKPNEITVTLSDNRQFVVQEVKFDKKTDLAIMRIKSRDPFPYVKLGDSDKSRVGDKVLAIGNPYGFGGSVSAGIISARGRDLGIDNNQYNDFIQIDAAINKGNSGGPLFDMNGKVIGMNTAIYSPTGGGNVGIGFSIPSNSMDVVIKSLLSGREIVRGYLGIVVQKLTKEIAESLNFNSTNGALVVKIDEKGPAVKSGLEIGDIIVEFDSVTVSSYSKLVSMASNAEVGKKVKVKIYRNGKYNEFHIKIGNAKDMDNINTNEQIEAFGLTVVDLSNEGIKGKYLADKVKKGVLIIKNNGIPGLVAGDIIMKIGEHTINNISDFTRVINKVKANNTYLFYINRGSSNAFVPVKIMN